MLKKIKKTYDRVANTLSFLRAFLSSQEGQEWRRGLTSLAEASQAYDSRMTWEHQVILEHLKRRRWVLAQRLRQAEARNASLQESIRRKGEELAKLRREAADERS